MTEPGRTGRRATPLATAILALLVAACARSAEPVLGPDGVAAAHDGSAGAGVAAAPRPDTSGYGPLSIGYLSDCAGDPADPPTCGPPPARWSPFDLPVPVCTVQDGRPPGLDAGAFRGLVSDAAATWNAQQAAVRFRYDGDCAPGVTFYGDGENQVAWTAESLESEHRLASTLGRWRVQLDGSKRLIEADVLLGSVPLEGAPAACLRAVVVHELGHALGIGHSDAPLDVMYPTLDLADPAGCRSEPTPAERQHLQSLYGVDAFQLVGTAPAPGAAGLLVVSGLGSPSDVTVALGSQGCRARVLAMLERGEWLIYVVGAPGQVNAAFPALLPPNTPLYVRCAP